MEFSFGKHKDKAVAWVLLTHPEYLIWMKKQGMKDKKEYQFAMRLLNKLEDKPFSEVRCSGSCKGINEVTRLSLYQGRNNLNIWFCDSCDPYELGANRGKLSSITSFSEFLTNGNQKNELLETYCRAKDVPRRKTKASLKAYFEY